MARAAFMAGDQTSHSIKKASDLESDAEKAE
jgi:hypothetical protein